MTSVSCPICTSTEVEDVLELCDVPVDAGILHSSPEAARNVQRGDIVLTLCRTCSCTWNRTYDPALTDYSAAYDCSLHHSATYDAFLRQTADALSARYDLSGRTVVEIGSGEGHFLRLLCERAGCDGIGIDPAGPEAQERVGNRTIRFIKEPVSDHHRGMGAALVVSRHMFIYLPDPLAIAQQIQSMGAAHYVEIPNAEFYFATSTLWAVYYENIFYFSRAALARTLSAAGMHVDVTPSYEDGQYLVAETALGDGAPAGISLDAGYLASVRAARDAFRNSVEAWHERLEGEDRSRVVVWGAAGRGTMFVNVLDPDAQISAVVDNNPAREGTYIAGSGHRVVAPEALVELSPDLIILTNSTYEREIRDQVASLGLLPRFAIA